jgi:hypothetical protein
MRVRAFLVCQSASVHDGLLFTLGGGINRLQTIGFPTMTDLVVAVALEVGPTERDMRHDVRVTMSPPGRRRELAESGAEFQAVADQAHPELAGVASFALPLRALINRPGLYRVNLEIDRRRVASMRLVVDLLGQG